MEKPENIPVSRNKNDDLWHDLTGVCREGGVIDNAGIISAHIANIDEFSKVT